MKWQLWNADTMYDAALFPVEYESAKRWQMPREWLPQLRDQAHERGLMFGCSAFDFDSLDFVDQFVDFHKVASIEATWLAYVSAVSAKQKPIICSVGMVNPDEFGDILVALDKSAGLPRTTFMGCTVAYPCAIESANVRQMLEIWPKRWGYSDHTTHPTIAPCAAVALGACVVEKHLRLNLDGAYEFGLSHDGVITPDWPHSITPHEFTEMVTAIRLTEKASGSSEKRIEPSEEPYLKYRRGPKGLRGS